MASGVAVVSLGFRQPLRSSKHQAPNTRKAPNLKLENDGRADVIGICCLSFFWSLVFGILEFPRGPTSLAGGPPLVRQAIGEDVGIDLVAVFDLVAAATTTALYVGRVVQPFGAVDQHDPAVDFQAFQLR